MTKVFVSYSRKQGRWVWDRLVPCLKAGGTDVLIDRERFEAGKAIVGQMDTVQDQADKHLLVLSDDYLNSPYCKHEMDRAIRLDPKFEHGIVVPVMRGKCSLPDRIIRPNPLYADLRNDKQPSPWDLVLEQCGADLGTTVPAWLEARDEIVRFLGRGESVNLVVDSAVNWRGLLDHVAADYIKGLAVVDLQPGATASRHGMLSAILKALGLPFQLPDEPEDLGEFEHIISARSRSLVCLTHFDLVVYRPQYGIDLFASLRHLLMEARKLVLLMQSRTNFAALLPRDHPLSPIDIKTVELRERS